MDIHLFIVRKLSSIEDIPIKSDEDCAIGRRRVTFLGKTPFGHPTTLNGITE